METKESKADANKQQAKDFLRTLLKDRLGNEDIDIALKELDGPGKGLVELEDKDDEEEEGDEEVDDTEVEQQNKEVQAMIEDDKKLSESSESSSSSNSSSNSSSSSGNKSNNNSINPVAIVTTATEEVMDPPPVVNSESIRTVPIRDVCKVVRGAQSCNLPPHRVTAGCTAVFSLLDHNANKLYVANAGDSRCVLCRSAVSVDLSDDHKPFNTGERNRIENAGGFVSQVGRINNNLNLSRSIGDLKYKQVQGIEAKEQIITAEPDIMCIDINTNDEFIILACDGVWDVMTNQDICDFVRERLVKYNTNGKRSGLFYDSNGNFNQLNENDSVRYNLSGSFSVESESDIYPLDAIVGDVMTFCLADSIGETALGTDNMTCLVIVFDTFIEKIKNKDESLIIVSEGENSEYEEVDSGVD